EILLSLAENGDAAAQNDLGVCYHNGTGIAKDEQEAVRWFHKAAEQGNVEAQRNLGLCYTDGLGIDKDEREAVKWFRKAAEQGHAPSQTNLGAAYYDGVGVSKDTKEAVNLFQKAAEQGYPNAQYLLGSCYANGVGIAKDEREAVRWFHKSAEQGFALAQHDLGICYENGIGVARNVDEAIKWFQKAAEQEHAESQRRLDFPPPSPKMILLSFAVFMLFSMGFIYWLLWERAPRTDEGQPAHANTKTSNDAAFYRDMAIGRSLAIKSLFISLAIIALSLFGSAFVQDKNEPLSMVLGFAMLLAFISLLVFMFCIARLSVLHNAGCGCAMVFLGNLVVPLILPVFALVILVRSGRVLRIAGYSVGVFHTNMGQFPEPAT
ncbi:MAG: sel1 repeat family protein, partial [Planctomycetaceae bacterium]|nr:sel1 repeat family protein [Planctomycetaceae bacterium]